LPNDFASDPDLKQVVARTLEISLRGDVADGSFNWSADVFHTATSNDIQFIATATNSGFFDNVGSTRRPNNWANENDVVPGAPRQLFVGIRIRFN
jgi:iron complex outermembrane receptor protein